VKSRVTRVTFFEDRAEVTRVAQAELAAGTSTLAIEGISPAIDERSVQAKAEGARVISARVVALAHSERTLGREAIEALELEARQARATVSTQTRALERAELSLERARGLLERWVEGASLVPRSNEAGDGAERWQRALGEIEWLCADSLRRATAGREALVRAQAELSRTNARLAAGKIESPRYEARVEVDVDAPGAGAIEVTLTYRVACALWRPEHTARLVDAPDDKGQARLEITTHATAWQCTGEAWEGIEARFSTARPARDAAAPRVTDDVLTMRRRSDEERRRVEVQAREQAMTVAGLERGARAVDEMPGVDDGGEPLQLSAGSPVTIASDGLPLRVEVAKVTLAAIVERVIFPEVATAAHLRATATLVGASSPLLAGPVRIARGASLVGRSKIDFVGKGEPFELGLGADDGVRVRRTLVAQDETQAVTGAQRRKRTVKVYVSNLSDETRRVLVTERIPVSEIEYVEVRHVEVTGWTRHDGGMMRREVELGPGATRVLELAYELRAPHNVALSL
jgi:uncharacterized protein (TIGR02231 family)